MATSGTIGTTTVDTAKMIEHAFRRAKVLPSAQTPETNMIARECLYFLLLNLSNRGLNLWCVEQVYLGLEQGRATYDLPQGTIDILNVTYSTPTIETSTFAAIAEGGTAQLAGAADILRVGFKLSAAHTGVLLVKSSDDGVTYTTIKTLDSTSYAANTWYWIPLDVVENATYFSVESAAAAYPSVSDIELASSVSDLPVTIWNRDTYMAINNKAQQGSPSTNYFFEKAIPPRVTLWPVPDNANNHLSIFRHREVQDIGTLTQSIEVPSRWYDGVIWLLAARLVFELPNIDTNVAQLVVQMADKVEFEAEMAETDGAPIYLTPGIGVYTR